MDKMEKPENMTRRNLLMGFAAIAPVATAVGMGEVGGLLYHHFRDSDGDDDEGGRDVPDDVVETRFPDGTVYSPQRVNAHLTQWYQRHDGERLFSHLDFSKTSASRSDQMRRLRRSSGEYLSNFTEKGIPLLMKDLERRGIVHRYFVEDDIKKSSLAHVDEVNAFWRCRTVGYVKGESPKNKPAFLRMMPGAVKELENISDAFQKKIHHAGLSSEWSVRFIVNSLVRTSKGTNKDLKNASPDSPHTFGMGFDISNIRFDLVHKKDGAFMMIGSEKNEGQESRDAAILTTLNCLLVEVLEDFHARQKIVLTYEGDEKHHYHVTSLKP